MKAGPMTKDADRWGPLTGALFVALAVAIFAVAGDAPDANDRTARQIVAYYSDHDGALIASVGPGLIGCALLVFFCAYLSSVLEGDLLPRVAFAGGVILAVGLVIDVTISVALVHAADHIDPVAIQALSSLYGNDYIPFVLGAMLIVLASGLAIVRQDNLPHWLGWLGIALALPAPTPLGAITFVGGGIWILLASVVLWTRERRTAGARSSRPPSTHVTTPRAPARDPVG
jgi:hypothetical protein